MLLYFFALYIAALFNTKARRLVRGQRLTIAKLKECRAVEDKWVWFHAASVGEFEQGRPIMERLKQDSPNTKILLTFFSPSGYELRKDYQCADLVAYLPFATRRNANRLIDILKPDKAIFIKYEYWPAYLKTLKKRGVETYIISAIFRKKQAFFKWWGAGYRKLLTCFTHLFVQDEESRELLEQYKITNVTVAGDTRFDRVEQIAREAAKIPELESFMQGGGKVIVAGSTWQPDEQMLLRYVSSHNGVRLVLVPHEIDTAHLHFIFNCFKGRYVRITNASSASLERTECLLVDTVGFLSRMYQYATVAYVGGGFGVGIHNTIEPAAFSKPVVFGPNYKDFREANGLIAAGGGFSYSKYEKLEVLLDQLLAEPTAAGQAAGEYVRRELGATNRIYTSIFPN